MRVGVRGPRELRNPAAGLLGLLGPDTGRSLRVTIGESIGRGWGGAGGATNPEELFAAGYAACFHSAMKFAGRGLGADLTGSGVSASVSIGTLAGGGFGLAVELVVEAPALDRETALAVAE